MLIDATDKAHLRAKEAAAEAARLKAKEAEVWNLVSILQMPSRLVPFSMWQSTTTTGTGRAHGINCVINLGLTCSDYKRAQGTSSCTNVRLN